MAEETSPSKGSRIPGWLKAFGTTILGMLSGVLIAYLSPLLDKAVKPAKPVANFQFQANGLNVAFQNHTTGATEGLWDFGDGSALQPYIADQQSVPHTYVKPGPYTVKLTVRNFVGDENERTVTVSVDQASAAPPTIQTFEVLPASPDSYAPATFKILTSIKDAEMCAWSLGAQPLEFSTDTARANGEQLRFVTFKEPGQYVIKLAAYNGNSVEVSKVVEVKKPPVGTLMASLTVTYDAMHVQNKITAPFARESFPPTAKGNNYPFARDVFGADDGYEFVQVAFTQPVQPAFVRNPQVKISPDKRKIQMSGELIKSSAQLPVWDVQMQITQQKRSAPAVKTMDPVSVSLAVPGSTLVPLPPLPPGWIAAGHKLALTLSQNDRKLTWNDGQLPRNVAVQMSSALFVINAAEQDNQLRIDLSEIPSMFILAGN
jgi:hypothetical protein